VDCRLWTVDLNVNNMNIILVGFMGTGKTVIGKKLASKRGMKYVSMDEEIEKKEKRSISEIFSKDGEPYFRKVEKEVAKELSNQDNLVIDAGGGVVLDEENISNLKASGRMVCLNASPDVIFKRTEKYKHRPLLNVSDPRKKIEELLEHRARHYKNADIQIDTSHNNIDKVVREIESHL